MIVTTDARITVIDHDNKYFVYSSVFSKSSLSIYCFLLFFLNSFIMSVISRIIIWV